jgi:hypothetical protein
MLSIPLPTGRRMGLWGRKCLDTISQSRFSGCLLTRAVCLCRFTNPERLGSEHNLICRSCQGKVCSALPRPPSLGLAPTLRLSHPIDVPFGKKRKNGMRLLCPSRADMYQFSRKVSSTARNGRSSFRSSICPLSCASISRYACPELLVQVVMPRRRAGATRPESRPCAHCHWLLCRNQPLCFSSIGRRHLFYMSMFYVRSALSTRRTRPRSRRP